MGKLPVFCYSKFMINWRRQEGYMILVIMVLTSVVLLLISFWMIRRRTTISMPVSETNNNQANKPVDEWTEFESKSYGIKFHYPKNIFEANLNPIKAGDTTRIFLGVSPYGTVTVEMLNQQFQRPAIGSATNISGQIGYRYDENSAGCEKRNIRVPAGNITGVIIFSSCVSDSDPKVATNQDLMQQFLNSVRLTPGSSSQSSIENFNLVVDDSGAAPNTVTLKAGNIAQLTFSVTSGNVADGGLSFKSTNIDTGFIFSGAAKTISFKVDEPMEFKVFGKNGVARNYTIKVKIE